MNNLAKEIGFLESKLFEVSVISEERAYPNWAVDDFIEFVKAELSTQWIPTSERLPENGKEVLVYSNRGRRVVAHLVDSGWIPEEAKPLFHGLDFNQEDIEGSEKAVYWMHFLPLPPK